MGANLTRCRFDLYPRPLPLHLPLVTSNSHAVLVVLATCWAVK